MTTFSFLVAYTTLGDSVEATLKSLQRQDWADWQLVVARPEGLSPAKGKDPRLLQIPLQIPSGQTPRSALLEAARSATTGDFVAVLDPGDQLEPGALGAFRLLVDSCPDSAGFYADEQWPGVGASGIARKPDFLPVLLESINYIGRPFLVRKDVAAEVGGILPANGQEEYDLTLRVTEFSEKICHLPAIALTREKPPEESIEATIQAVERRLSRTGRRGTVEPTVVPQGVRTWLDLTAHPRVSIVIPTAGGRREIRGEQTVLVTRCLQSLTSLTTYPEWEIIVVASAHTPPEILDEIATIVDPDRLQITGIDGPFNFSASVNEGARVAQGELLLFLNDDTEVIEPRWLDRMVAVASDPKIGAVGAKLLFGDGTIQHVGVTVDDSICPIHPLVFEADGIGPWGAKVLDTDWEAVTAACFLTPAALYRELGGFTEDLPLNFNDLDYCFKVRQSGRRIVCTPFATLWHYESSSRIHRLEQWEVDTLQRTWHMRMTTDPHVQYRSHW